MWIKWMPQSQKCEMNGCNNLRIIYSVHKSNQVCPQTPYILILLVPWFTRSIHWPSCLQVSIPFGECALLWPHGEFTICPVVACMLVRRNTSKIKICAGDTLCLIYGLGIWFGLFWRSWHSFISDFFMIVVFI